MYKLDMYKLLGVQTHSTSHTSHFKFSQILSIFKSDYNAGAKLKIGLHLSSDFDTFFLFLFYY